MTDRLSLRTNAREGMLKGVVRAFRFVSTYFFFFSFVLSLLLARPTIARLVEEAFNKKIRDEKRVVHGGF